MQAPAYIVVTRPAHQAEALASSIEAAGGKVLRFPVIDIQPLSPTTTDQAILQALPQYDLIIFISSNAVQHGLPLLQPLPASLQTACVGKATAAAFQRLSGKNIDLVPEKRFNSEGLLALPQLQHVSGKKILIVRGNGGRELLADTLRQRGAEVDYLNVYQRQLPHSNSGELQQYLQNQQIAAIVITSAEGLHNLLQLTPDHAHVHLQQVPLVLIDARLVSIAQQAGFKGQLLVAASASDAAIIQTLQQHIIAKTIS